MAYRRFKPKCQLGETIVDDMPKGHDVLEPMNVAILSTKFFIDIVVSKLADDRPGICRGVPLMVM